MTKKSTTKKIAVFISGPPRYVNLVVEQLGNIFKDKEYDCFIHIWKTDSGNKIREKADFNYGHLGQHPKVKVLITQKPYDESTYKNILGTESGSGSPVFATMGMFLGVNNLCHALEIMPDFSNYSHVLRLRTDCAILTKKFKSLLSHDPNTISVSENYIIPSGWLSDHIMFATVDNFFKIWKHDSMVNIYKAYKKGSRNPERALAYLTRRGINKIKINPNIVRYRDYHIVYSPGRPEDPKWSNKVIKEGKIKELFLDPEKYIDRSEIRKYNRVLKQNRPPAYHFGKKYQLIMSLLKKFTSRNEQ